MPGIGHRLGPPLYSRLLGDTVCHHTLPSRSLSKLLIIDLPALHRPTATQTTSASPPVNLTLFISTSHALFTYKLYPSGALVPITTLACTCTCTPESPSSLSMSHTD